MQTRVKRGEREGARWKREMCEREGERERGREREGKRGREKERDDIKR